MKTFATLEERRKAAAKNLVQWAKDLDGLPPGDWFVARGCDPSIQGQLEQETFGLLSTTWANHNHVHTRFCRYNPDGFSYNDQEPIGADAIRAQNVLYLLFIAEALRCGDLP